MRIPFPPWPSPECVLRLVDESDLGGPPPDLAQIRAVQRQVESASEFVVSDEGLPIQSYDAVQWAPSGAGGLVVRAFQNLCDPHRPRLVEASFVLEGHSWVCVQARDARLKAQVQAQRDAKRAAEQAQAKPRVQKVHAWSQTVEAQTLHSDLQAVTGTLLAVAHRPDRDWGQARKTMAATAKTYPVARKGLTQLCADLGIPLE